MAYIYLFIAIFLEVIAAIATRYTEGFTVLLPTVITILFAIASYFIFSLSLKHGMDIGVGYAIWSGVGVLSVALIGGIALGDKLSFIQIMGILSVIVGLMIVQLTGKKEGTVRE